MAKIDEIEKMLKAVLSGLTGFRQEFLNFKKEVLQRFDGMDKKIDGVEERLTQRIDVIGKQVAYLEDDVSTREEFDKLGKRVDKLEKSPSAFR